MVVKRADSSDDNKIWLVYNANSGDILAGIIVNDDKEYVIRPYSDVVFSAGCLKDIFSFVVTLKRLHRDDRSRIIFDEIVAKTKTKKFDVLKEARNGNDTVGVIKFYPAWRQYCFFPEGEKNFNLKDLEEIWAFICELNEQRKKKA